MLQIHGVPISVHTRKLIVAAIHKQLPYQIEQVVPVVPGATPPNWRELSPTGLIPALVDGDFRLADSLAIGAYLERAYPAHPIYPSGAREHARALWFEQYAGGTLFRDVVHPLFHEIFVNPQVRQLATDAARVDAVLSTTTAQVFHYLDSVSGESFLVGTRMSMADVAVVSNLLTFQYIGCELDRARYPALAGLFDRVVREPSMREAIRREQTTVQAMGLSSDCVAALLA